MKKLIVSTLLAIALVGSAFAATTTTGTTSTNKTVVYTPEQQKLIDNSWVLAVQGGGATQTKSGGTSAFSTELALGHTGFLLLPIEAGVRQSFSYGGGNTIMSTRAYSDWTVLTYKKFDVFVGANLGAKYGNTAFTWTAAPELGARYWIKENIAIVGRAEYGFDLNPGHCNNTLAYYLGLSIKL